MEWKILSGDDNIHNKSGYSAASNLTFF